MSRSLQREAQRGTLCQPAPQPGSSPLDWSQRGNRDGGQNSYLPAAPTAPPPTCKCVCIKQCGHAGRTPKGCKQMPGTGG